MTNQAVLRRGADEIKPGVHAMRQLNKTFSALSSVLSLAAGYAWLSDYSFDQLEPALVENESSENNKRFSSLAFVTANWKSGGLSVFGSMAARRSWIV